jgi:superfamily I DNA/RNA helicase
MKYISVELSAVDEIIGNRFLQSVEFAHGKDFATLLKGQSTSSGIWGRITATKTDDGGVFFTLGNIPTHTRFIVFDCEQSKIFDDLSDSDTLFVFQKVLRLAKKLWGGLALNFSERVINNSSKALVFPFRGFKPAPFRVTIERDPSGDRLAKRGDKGNYLLVYKAGHEGADAVREVAGLTNFKKAYDAVSDVRLRLAAQRKDSAKQNVVNQLQVANLPGGTDHTAGSMYRTFDGWEPLLTAQQKDFVEAPLVHPHRIEGAAGTGKTLSLMLKAVAALKKAKHEGKDFHAVFVTHSDATRRSISDVLSVIDDSGMIGAERNTSPQTMKVCTLSELCAEQLRQAISDAEFIDRDAMESKGLQLLYIAEALDEAMKSDFASHERFLSPEFASFLKTEESWKITEMIQHEISVLIKGRSSEELDTYKKALPLKYGLPIKTHADKGFIFAVFRLYQKRLGDVGQFDTDDVVLTTIGQLDTPIWRRRRSREGYDAIFIDETHLFNINELHLFHYFTKTEGPYPIAYSVDRAQAVGDRGWTTEDIAASIADDEHQEGAARIKTVFRSSADIVNLAFAIVSSGATLFTNFDNPLDIAPSGFTDADDRMTAQPRYFNVANDEALIEAAYSRAEQMQREMGCKRSDILIVTLDENLLVELENFASSRNKPHVVLKKRGDHRTVEAARQASQVVLAHADYVGGLEFMGVVLVGIDAGRVPPAADGSESSRNYLAYAAHNRLYVAVTRAKYRVELIGEKARGPSKILDTAITSGLLSPEDLS